ncbi:hypothetical protein BD408DRAFT_457542, partial [Parasitella parasitica]
MGKIQQRPASNYIEEFREPLIANILINGTSKYNRNKRSKEKKKKKRRKENKKKRVVIDNPSKPKKQKWKPAPYLESKTKIPLIVFGAGMFGKDAVKLKG